MEKIVKVKDLKVGDVLKDGGVIDHIIYKLNCRETARTCQAEDKVIIITRPLCTVCDKPCDPFKVDDIIYEAHVACMSDLKSRDFDLCKMNLENEEVRAICKI